MFGLYLRLMAFILHMKVNKMSYFPQKKIWVPCPCLSEDGGHGHQPPTCMSSNDDDMLHSRLLNSQLSTSNTAGKRQWLSVSHLPIITMRYPAINLPSSSLFQEMLFWGTDLASSSLFQRRWPHRDCCVLFSGGHPKVETVLHLCFLCHFGELIWRQA
jgi:hypothetical protein